MSFLSKFVWKCRTFVAPIIVIISAALFLRSMGYKNLVWIIVYAGPLIVMFGNLAYIVFWHSRKRWPKNNWRKRLEKVITF